MAILRKQGPDFAEHLEFHLTPYTNKKTIAVECSLLSQASYIVEKGADGVSGNTLVKMLFPRLSTTVELGGRGSLLKQHCVTLSSSFLLLQFPASCFCYISMSSVDMNEVLHTATSFTLCCALNGGC